MTDRTFADELLELIKTEPEHLVVLPAEVRRWPAWMDYFPGLHLLNGRLPATVWIVCHASIDEAGEYDLRPIAEVIGPDQRLRFNQYRNPLVNLGKERP